ncbi:MAG: hypothetical protein HDR80_08395 [Bacteroides sp.]|nr:hypothetical protein [Bacteroides sp.]
MRPVVALMGLSFKPDIDGLRESPAMKIVSAIVSDVEADILVSEPNLASHPLFTLTTCGEACRSADIVVFLVGHREFLLFRPEEGKVVLDFCGVTQG